MRKTKKKLSKKMKGGDSMNKLIKLLQCGGFNSLRQPGKIHMGTKIANVLNTIEADVYKSDEYWILYALENGLSNCTSFSNMRNKAFFEIDKLLSTNLDKFNTELEGILDVWLESIHNDDINIWDDWIEQINKKYSPILDNTEFLKNKYGVENKDILLKRVKEGYYGSENPFDLFRDYNDYMSKLNGDKSIQSIRDYEEREQADDMIREIEEGVGVEQSDMEPSRSSQSDSIDIGFDKNIKPVSTKGYRYPRPIPFTGAYDNDIKKMAELFVESINSTNKSMLNELLKSYNKRHNLEDVDNYISNMDSSNKRIRDREGGGKKRNKKLKKTKKRKKKKKTKKRKK